MRDERRRFVYYLEAPTETLATLDGSREGPIRTKIERFLGSPRSTFSKQLASNVRQVKHRGSKMRAFGTWCRDDDRELLVVQAIYRKRNEGKYFDYLDEYDAEGREYKDQFQQLTDDEFQAWQQSLRDRDGVILQSK